MTEPLNTMNALIKHSQDVLLDTKLRSEKRRQENLDHDIQVINAVLAESTREELRHGIQRFLLPSNLFRSSTEDLNKAYSPGFSISYYSPHGLLCIQYRDGRTDEQMKTDRDEYLERTGKKWKPETASLEDGRSLEYKALMGITKQKRKQKSFFRRLIERMLPIL